MLLLIYCLLCTAHVLKADVEGGCKDWSSHYHYYLLNNDNCGRTEDASATSKRIIYGNKTSPNEHPWMTIVAVAQEADGEPSLSRTECVGTLINNRYVMTAGSCLAVEGKNQKVHVWLRVYQAHRLEIINCNLQKCSLPPIKVEVESYFIHPDFNINLRYANIALIRMNKTVKFEDFLRPICLPVTCDFRNTDLVGTMATMLGFDNTGDFKVNASLVYNYPIPRTGLEASALEKSLVKVISQQACQDQWKRDQEIQWTQLCGTWPGGIPVCEKDVGGPLLTETHRNGLQWVQIGIISQGLCDHKFKNAERPNVFTTVGDYISFILETIAP